MSVALETSRGPLICADYDYSRDGRGELGVTAVTLRYDGSQYLAGHLVDAKGASSESGVRQVLKDGRTWATMGR